MKQLSSLLKTLILATTLVALPALAWRMPPPFDSGTLPPETTGPTGNFGLFLNTSDTDQGRIGSLGIGTATPGAYKLNVNGTSYLNGTSTVNGVNSVSTGVQLASGLGGSENRYVSYYGAPTTGYFTQMQTTATGGYGTYGPVTSDWALYNRFNGANTRGWIWQLGTTNVAGLSGQGNFQVAGTVTAPSITLTTGAAAGKVLTSTDASGATTWQTPAAGIGGSGTTNYLTKWTGATALGNSTLFDNGTNVGIGTALPATKLDVYQASDAADNAFALRSFSAPSTRYTSIWSGSGGSVIDAKGVSAGSGLNFYVNGTERMKIQDSGNVGIGTSAPESRLQLGDATVSTANQIIFGKADTASETYLPVIQQKSILSAGASNDLALGARSTNGGILFYTGATSAGTGSFGGALGTSNNAARMTITANGNVGIGTDATPFQGPLALYDTTAAGLTSTLTLQTAANGLGEIHFAKGTIGTDRYTGAIRYDQLTDKMTFNTATTPKLTILGTGQVGIGTQTPGASLEVAGKALINGMHIGHGTGVMQDPASTAVGTSALGSSNIGTYNTAFGGSALTTNSSGGYNTALGSLALFSNNTNSYNSATGAFALTVNDGNQNTANGTFALYGNVAGSDNTAVGYSSLAGNVAGSGATTVGSGAMQYSNDTATAFTNANTAVGFQALQGPQPASGNTGNDNTAVGYQSLKGNTTGSSNIAIGYMALLANSTGTGNTAVGWNSLLSNTTGNYNTANGRNALRNNTMGSDNTAFGWKALFNNTYGTTNTATGDSSLFSNTSGFSNAAVGYEALRDNTTGYQNTAIGQAALFYNISGDSNTAIGTNSLTSNTTGYSNTAIGAGANVASGALTNATAIGAEAVATASNMIRLGDTALTSVIQGRVAYSYPSDLRLKENIAEYTHGLDFITKLRPITYNLKSDVGTKITRQGFIAQEVEAIGIPFYGLNKPANDKDFYSLSYSDFVVPLVNSVKELKSENDQLRATNSALLLRIEAIEAKLK